MERFRGQLEWELGITLVASFLSEFLKKTLRRPLRFEELKTTRSNINIVLTVKLIQNPCIRLTDEVQTIVARKLGS